MQNQRPSDKKLPEYILYLENKYPVETWCINGVFVWPYIRIKLYITLLSKSLGGNVPKSEKWGRATSTLEKKTNKLALLFRSVSGFIKYQMFLYRLTPKPLIFFGSHDHRVEENGLWFNRFFDSMVKTHGLEDKVYMFEYLKIQKNLYNKQSVVPFEKELENYRAAYAIKNKLSVRKSKSLTLDRYPGFLIELETCLNLSPAQLGLTEPQLAKWVKKLLFLKHFFSRVYQKIKPQKVVFAGYYGWDNLYAAIYTANTMGIKTIDYQHGPQTNHMVFTSWNKHPKIHYNLMPVEYWNWDEGSKKNIEAWAKHGTGVTAKISGQSYLAYTKNKADNKLIGTHIFFSLQGFDLKEMVPGPIIKSIKDLPYHWVFRLHPRSEFSNEDVLGYLSDLKVPNDKITVQSSKQVPIVETLSNAIVHITCFSGCVIEASLMGVPSVVIHQEGKNMFKSYIDAGIVYCLDSKTENFYFRLYEHIVSFEKKNYNSGVLQVINPLSF